MTFCKNSFRISCKIIVVNEDRPNRKQVPLIEVSVHANIEIHVNYIPIESEM